ncbi:hypothetical protein HK097_002066 [Rhizophlyctis rosea]|uniref:Ribosomal RNA-processing protein 43 n=1 Tax=Rhizophlyctis rosea TaxID=64517 RepID=A0AAD5SH55_9FUNG|nr:hypothetical protein HK097_002066 [Rhizophlyctis rosea]
MDIDTAADATTNGASHFTLDADTFRKIHPAEYNRRFISQGVRADGRPLQRFRKANVNVGSITTANGSSMVRLGNTTVICGIKAEVTEPTPEAPRAGFLVPNLDLPALCSPQFRPGPPGELAQTISEYINQICTSTNLLNLDDLCIASGQAVWVLHADILCLNYEGNALDAALAALIAALWNVRLPKSTYDELEGTVRAAATNTIPLVLNRLPLAATFGVFDAQHLIADPTDQEEPLLSSQLAIVVDQEDNLCGILKEGSAMDRERMVECIGLARNRAQALRRLIDEALAKADAS